MEHDGMYVKVPGDPTYWAVDGGERRQVHSQQEMLEIGLRPVVTVDPEVLERIPVKGSRKRGRKSEGEEWTTPESEPSPGEGK